MTHFLTRQLTRLRKNKDGISAVEFALVAPLLLLLFFGSIELSQMMQMDRKVTASTSTLGDLVARAAVVDDDDMDDIFAATALIFAPSPMTNARLRVSSIINNGGTPEVQWSSAQGFTPHPQGTTLTVPNGLIPAGGSVIFAEIEYDYSSTIGYFLKNDRVLKDKFYLRPRRVNFVQRVEEAEPST